MAKKVGVVMMGSFITVFIGLNLYLYFRRANSQSTMSGMAVSNLPMGLNVSLIAFILQWVVLLLIIIFAYTKFLKHRKEEEEKIQHLIIPSPKSKAETNIDVLYNFLKQEKSLSIGAISKIFNITKETALEWGKILEDNDLAIIEYPAFADPEINIKEEEGNVKATKKQAESVKQELKK